MTAKSLALKDMTDDGVFAHRVLAQDTNMKNVLDTPYGYTRIYLFNNSQPDIGVGRE